MEKDLNPYEFTIEIDGLAQAIRAEQPKPGDFIIYINGERTGHIYPVVSPPITEWKSQDKMDQALVSEIGQHIETLEKNAL